MPATPPLQLANEMDQTLLDHSLKAWFPRCIDTAAGGDGGAGGYAETLEPRRQGNDAIGTPFGQRSSTTLLQVLEALTELRLAYPNDTAGARLEECLVVLECVVRRDGRLCRRYDAAWRPVDRSGSYGHDVEACVLARRARRALGIDGDSPLRHIAERALRRGYDRRYGGLFSGVRRDAFRRDTNKTWWVQAELLNYLASKLVTRPEAAEETLQRIRHAWRFIADRQIDPVHGGWLASVSRDGGLVLQGGKGQAWKAIYHELRALLNAADALPTIGAGPDHCR